MCRFILPAFGWVDQNSESSRLAFKVWEAWFDAYERGDPDTLAGFFAEDGIYAANTGQMLRCRAGIREGVSAWVALKSRHLEGYGLHRQPDRH